MTTRGTTTVREPRALDDVVQDVLLWQGRLIVGRDPGATPVGESGWPLSRLAARTYFGVDMLDTPAASAVCAV